MKLCEVFEIEITKHSAQKIMEEHAQQLWDCLDQSFIKFAKFQIVNFEAL